MTLLYSLIYLAAIGALSFIVGRLIPKRLFKAHRFPYRPFVWERDGQIYRRLRISAWQARVPDMSRILPGFMPLKRIRRRPSDAELVRMVQETCVAECTHCCLAVLGLGLFLFMPGWRGLILYAAYVLLGNLPFVLIQRYNRPRLVHMLASSRRRADQIRNKCPENERRILILSCNTGEGHNACAAAIAEAFESRGYACQCDDALRFVSPLFSRLMSGGHVWIYRHFPALFRFGYRFTERHPESLNEKSLAYRAFAFGADPLLSAIIDGEYHIVVCTHVFAAMMLSEAKKRYPLHVKTAFVVTDYTGYPGVDQCNVDLCFVPDSSLEKHFVTKNIPAEHVVSSGIPVRRAVCRRTERAFARKSMDIPADSRHLLIMCGSMGCGPIRRLIRLLVEDMDPSCFLTVVCGTNHKLKKHLERSHANHPRVRIIGFTDQVSLLMDSADLYLTKPGGLSVTEAAVKALPMVMINAVAGCETHNRNFFLKSGLGVTAETTDALANLCRDILADPACLNRMSAAAKPFAGRDAANQICSRLLDEPGDREMPIPPISEPAGI